MLTVSASAIQACLHPGTSVSWLPVLSGSPNTHVIGGHVAEG